MTTILIIGAADTGRAPMAAALLRRRIATHGLAWDIGSAGVLGHDDDGPETEARDAMAALGLDIGEHRARSVSDELIAEAALLVAVDSGTAMVLRARFAAAAPRTHTLGDLAGKQRDIPDPFRMQIGAWMGYARELDGLLRDALPRMIVLLESPTEDSGQKSEVRSQKSGARSQEPGDEQEGSETQNSKLKTQNSPRSPRQETVARMERLLTVAAEQPDVVRWDTARAQIEAGIAQAATPLSGDDLALAYAGVLRAALALSANPPTAGQLAALRSAVAVLHAPVAQEAITAWSGRLAGWAGL